jgi:LL-diaminopimelate aminotransferase
LHSLSKSFNMTGWRIGWVCGNPLAVRAYGDVKDNSDSGQFAAIQKAAAYCLDHSEITTWITNKYSRRMDLLVAVLKKNGFNATKPRGSFFLYVKAPKAGIDAKGERREFKSAEDFSQFLITEQSVSTVPWDDVGPYVRWSVTYEAAGIEKENAAMVELEKRLRAAKLEF